MSRRTERIDHDLHATEEELLELGAPRTPFGPVFLLVTGTLLLAAGLVLGFAPHYSWQVTKLARALLAWGFDPVLVGGAGFVLVSMGILGRSIAIAARQHEAPPPPAEPDFDPTVIVEQVACEVAKLEIGLARVSEDLGQLRASHESLSHQVARGEEQESSRPYDSIFRLAASLDHVHAKLDERIGALTAEMRSQLGTLSGQVQQGSGDLGAALRRDVEALAEELRRSVAEATRALVASRPAPAAARPAPPKPAGPRPAAPRAAAAAPSPLQKAKPAKGSPPAPAHAVPEDIYSMPPSAPVAPLSPMSPLSIDIEDELEVLVDLEGSAGASGPIVLDDVEEVGSLVRSAPEAEEPPGGALEFDIESLLPEESLRRVLEDERRRSQG